LVASKRKFGVWRQPNLGRKAGFAHRERQIYQYHPKSTAKSCQIRQNIAKACENKHEKIKNG
jgi:hypothetical protein